MRNALTICSLLLAGLATVVTSAPAESEAELATNPVFKQALASAPMAKVSEARSHFDGRSAPAEAISTNKGKQCECGPSCSCQASQPASYQFVRRGGPLRRAFGWVFRRRRC